VTIGRFAPSPSGPLHFGSLVAALGSFLSARNSGGRWLLRIEDIDGPRVVPGATAEILKALDAYGLHWDGPLIYQSQRQDRYRAALERLVKGGRVYACSCSRRQISEVGKRGPTGYLYPGTCRNAGLAFQGRALRVSTAGASAEFVDRIQGLQAQSLEREVGDFVLRRADGAFSYQLAVVIDDADQSVTEIVRGHDILDSTGRQIYLQRLLEFAEPAYAHLPLAVDAEGRKLSKMSGARAVALDGAGPTLFRALEFLAQQPPKTLAGADPEELLAWAIPHWDESLIPARSKITSREFI